MSFDLRELYQETILTHAKRPRNFGPCEQANARAEGFNPLCGDRVEVYLLIDANDRIQDVHFTGEGCAISVASASLMTEAIKGKSKNEALAVFEMFRKAVTDTDGGEVPEELGDLAILAGVRDHPVRIKCATLAWHAMHAAMQNQTLVSTE